MPREMRSLVPFEVALVVAAAAIPLPIPATVPLLVVASVSLWLRGRSFAAVVKGPALYAAIGALAGAIALAVALFVSTPLVEALTDAAVEWSMYPIVRGSTSQAIMVAIVVGISAVAAELVVHGWLLERALELRAPPVISVLLAGFAEALLVGAIGPSEADAAITARIGTGIFGLGLAWMYLAAGRSVVAPLCARLAFLLGAIVLETTRAVG